MHPIQITTPTKLSKLFPKLRVYKSQLSGKILYSGSLGGHTIQIRGIGEIIQSLLAGHLDHLDLKDILKKPRDILKKPSDFLLPIHTSENLSKNTEVVHVQIHQQQVSCDDISSDDEKLNKKLIQKVMTIKDITDLETTPEGILVEDLGSDYDDDMYMYSEMRDGESFRDSQKFCSEHCNTLQQSDLEDSSKKDFYWGDTFTNLT